MAAKVRALLEDFEIGERLEYQDEDGAWRLAMRSFNDNVRDAKDGGGWGALRVLPRETPARVPVGERS